MFAFGISSLWHLAAVSVVKCTVIVRPLTHFNIFTDRVLRAIMSILWTLSLIVGCSTNISVIEIQFSWATMIASVKRHNIVIANAFGVCALVIPTLIIMISYTKVFLVVRRQVRSTSIAVPGPLGLRSIFGSSVRSAKNLFVMCAAFYVTYIPGLLSLMLTTHRWKLSDAVYFSLSWIYLSSSAVNGFLYISLHSSVRDELRRYLPRCRRRTVAVAPSARAVDDGGGQMHGISLERRAVAPPPGDERQVPSFEMTLCSQRATEQTPVT